MGIVEKPALVCAVVLLLSAGSFGCVNSDAILAPGEKTTAPWGVDSLCDNNPEECEDGNE